MIQKCKTKTEAIPNKGVCTELYIVYFVYHIYKQVADFDASRV